MTLRCGCENEADDIVFGSRHRCTARDESVYADNIQAELKRVEGDLPPLVPSWRFVVPESEPVLRDPYDLDDDERRGF